MPPHQQRVIDEKADLDGKRDRLAVFFLGPVFAKLDNAEQERLGKQYLVLTEYSDILSQRIAAFQ